MDRSITLNPNRYTRDRGLSWAGILGVCLDLCGRPAKFGAVDFLIRFDWENGIAAVFCTQGHRRGEAVITTDTRNPHVAVLQQIEACLDALRAETQAPADEDPNDALDDGPDACDGEENDGWTYRS